MKITSKTINYTVETVEELSTIVGQENDVIVVTDENRGGTFVYRSAEAGTNNGGTLFDGWARQYSGAVNVKWFGAKGDGITDDTVAIQSAMNLFDYIVCNVSDIYLCLSQLEFKMDNQYFDLCGATLKVSTISNEYDRCVMNLSGGIIDGTCKYVTIAEETVAGSNTIVVENTANISIGDKLASSYYDVTKAVEFPLSGQTGRLVTNIVGNTITLDSAMSGTVTTLPAGLVVGSFEWSALFGSSKSMTIKNGTIKNAMGYYYHTYSTPIEDSFIEFSSIYFESNGLDQFLTKDNQVLKLNNCTANAPHDYAKTGIMIYPNGKVEINNSNLELGNYDNCITFQGNHTSENTYLKINGNSIISGIGNRLLSQTKCLNGISIASTSGNINEISVSSNVTFRELTRFFFTSTTVIQTYSLTISKVLFKCDIEAVPYSFIYSGAGNGLTINKFSFSDCSIYAGSIYVSSSSALAGAVNNYTVLFDNCNMRMQNIARSYPDAIFNGGKFDTCADIKLTLDTTLFNNVVLKDTKVIVSPSYGNYFQNIRSSFIIDNALFPSSIDSIVGVGTARNYSMPCTVRGTSGSLTYTVVKFADNVGGLVLNTIENFSDNFITTGTDWYVTRGAQSIDRANGLVSRISYSLQTTLTASSAVGSTSITVSSVSYAGNRPAVGDFISIQCDNGMVFTSKIAAGYTDGSLTIPLTISVPYASKPGSGLSFFRVV